jgi:exopolyphosphatase/guanosine-5'-triphosphate,3'-diphosphate pyrophosphatase
VGRTSTPAGRIGVPVIAASADVGSNSVHLFVAVVGEHRLEPLLDESAFLGLGGAVDERGRLGRLKRAELAATLARFAGVARDLDAATTTFVATEPLRRADDRRPRCATPSGPGGSRPRPEPRGGLPHALTRSPAAADLVVVDVGVEQRVRRRRLTGPRSQRDPSAPSRLTAAFVHRPADPEEAGRCATRRAIVSPRLTRRRGPSRSGTRPTSSRLVGGGFDRGPPGLACPGGGDPHLGTAAYAAIHHAINPMRARVLTAGVAILEALLDRYGLDRLHVVDTGVREGAVLAATRGGADWRTDLEALARGWRH